MKIVIVNQHPADHLAGSEIQCDLLAAALQKRGHQVTYLAIGSTPASLRQVATDYAIQPVLPRRRAVLDAVRANDPDVVYWRSCKLLFVRTAAALREAGFPIVYAVSALHDVAPLSRFTIPRHGVGDWFRSARDAAVAYSQRRAYRHVAAMSTLNEDFLDKIPTAIKVHVPNVMDSRAEPFVWPRPYCAWVANLKVTKQPERYVALASELKDEGVDFLMMGRLADRRYSWITDRSRIPQNLHYLSTASVQQVNGFLRGSHFHVHTCMPEGFGNVFIQAWLQEKPSVSLAFDPGGYLSDHSIGVYAGGDWTTFVGGVRRLIRQRQVRAEMGVRAREFAERSFSLDVSVSRLEEVMLRLARSPLSDVASYECPP